MKRLLTALLVVAAMMALAATALAGPNGVIVEDGFQPGVYVE